MEAISKSLLCNASLLIELSCKENNFGSEFCPRGTSATSLPTLGIAIGCVVRMGSQEEMVGVNAGWIIATVKDAQMTRRCSKSPFIGNAMCRDQPFLSSADLPISTVIALSSPENAAVCSLRADVRKEVMHQRAYSLSPLAELRAETPIASFDSRRKGAEGKRLAAGLAQAGDLARMTWHSGPPKQVQVQAGGVRQTRHLHSTNG